MKDPTYKTPVRNVELKRFYPAGAIYFITNNIDGHRWKMNNEAVLLELARIISEEKLRLGFKLAAYVIMSNHFHLLVQPNEINSISKVMASIKRRSSKSINRINDDEGKLWQHQFMNHIIRTGSDYENHLAYIHKNPLKHRLVINLADYRWSSWHQYNNSERAADILIDKLAF